MPGTTPGNIFHTAAESLMENTRRFELVSVHGGHSAQFCNHAENTLEEIIQAYAHNGFAWVGITEHMPPPDDRFLYPDEKTAGLDSLCLANRFSHYMDTCRSLQQKYQEQIELFVGFETETYSGSLDHTQTLRTKYKPDYIVGSVHHVNDICFDFSPDLYRNAINTVGDIDSFYLNYFDLQYRMIDRLKPEVVGHFDLVRIYDKNYSERLKKPQIYERIDRNLNLIADLSLILDLNVRSYYKGATEPYPSRHIIKRAIELGIAIVPGDDSHGVATVGLHMDRGCDLLKNLGGSTLWRKPGTVTG